MIKNAFIAFLLFICLCACNRTNNIVKDTIGKKITHVSIDTIESVYSILRYVDNPSCTSCQLHAGGWKVFNRKIQKKYQEKVKVFFIIETEKPEEAKRIIKMYKPTEYYSVDSTFNFPTANHLNKGLGKDFVVLLDSTRRVIAVGDPVNNPKAEELFFNLMDQEVVFADNSDINQ